MSWLILLVLFWKPLYLTSLYLYEGPYQKNYSDANINLALCKNWWLKLWDLLKL